MGRVLYDGSRLIPAPFVSIQKTYERADDGQKLGSLFTIQLSNDLVTFKGSPDSDQTLWTAGGYPPDEVVAGDSRLASALRKQEALRELFSQDGRLLEIQSNDGSQPMKCNPTVKDINIDQGSWYNVVKYTITLEANAITVNGIEIGEDDFDQYISTASESWSFETDEETPESVELNRTYRLTHTLSAKGKVHYDETGAQIREPWEQARAWVLPRLGLDSAVVFSSGVHNLPSYYGGYNHVRTSQTDKIGGNFSATEAWILASGAALEDFTVETSTNSEDGKTRVSINGSIKGLEVRNGDFQVTSSKFVNADSKWSGVYPILISRAQNYSNKTLNIIPLGSTVGKNPALGIITYGFEYDNRPSNVLTDSVSEVISLEDNFDVDAIAVIPILGRVAGPLIQDLNSHRENARTLNIEVVYDPEILNTGNIVTRFVTNNPIVKEPYKTEIQSIVDAVNPVSAGLLNNAGVAASVRKVVNQTAGWDGSRFSLNITWVWE
jgi:hypothetical protein